MELAAGQLRLRCFWAWYYTTNVCSDSFTGRKDSMANYSLDKYIVNKGPIAGPLLKVPFIGPFLQSVNPKFEEYHAKWMSGPLSCVSVFHKYALQESKA
jgi:hypothetical protein